MNNRDLATFAEDLGVGERLAALHPAEVIAVAESAVRSPADAARLAAAGFDAVLVGEALVRADDPTALGARPRGRARESEVVMDTRFVLPQDQIPTAWYNALPDLPEPLQPPLHPGTKEPVGPDDLAPLFPMALIEQEMTGAPPIDIPGEVLDILRLWRPTPLVRARRLEAALGTPARIYYKDESVSPAGSHKPNTAVAQAFYNKRGRARTGSRPRPAPGQWGTRAVVRVRAVRPRVQGLHGARLVRAEAVPPRADGDVGRVGRAVAGRRPDPSRVARRRDQRRGARRRAARRLALLARLGAQPRAAAPDDHRARGQGAARARGRGRPDVVIGSCGGGSNLGGIALPFMTDAAVRLLAVEPASCPTLTGGKFEYDFGDTAMTTPLLPMYTLGHDFVPPSIHAGGLRYHGDSPIISLLVKSGRMEAVAYPQGKTFEAAVQFARTEGKIPAPETGHAIRAAIDEALAAKEAGEERVILFNYSGHGFLDLQAYDDFNHGRLIDA